jgi:hypothetical protein
MYFLLFWLILIILTKAVGFPETETTLIIAFSITTLIWMGRVSDNIYDIKSKLKELNKKEGGQ